MSSDKYNHSEVENHIYSYWEKNGFPSSGWSVCKGFCYCVLDPVGNMDQKVIVPTSDEKKSILSNQKKEIDKLMGVPDLVPANQGLWFDNEAESFLYNMFLELERHYPRTEAESKIWTKIYTTIKTLSNIVFLVFTMGLYLGSGLKYEPQILPNLYLCTHPRLIVDLILIISVVSTNALSF